VYRLPQCTTAQRIQRAARAVLAFGKV
jgi:hypothetical protein